VQRGIRAAIWASIPVNVAVEERPDAECAGVETVWKLSENVVTLIAPRPVTVSVAEAPESSLTTPDPTTKPEITLDQSSRSSSSAGRVGRAVRLQRRVREVQPRRRDALEICCADLARNPRRRLVAGRQTVRRHERQLDRHRAEMDAGGAREHERASGERRARAEKASPVTVMWSRDAPPVSAGSVIVDVAARDVAPCPARARSRERHLQVP